MIMNYNTRKKIINRLLNQTSRANIARILSAYMYLFFRSEFALKLKFCPNCWNKKDVHEQWYFLCDLCFVNSEQHEINVDDVDLI